MEYRGDTFILSYSLGLTDLLFIQYVLSCSPIEAVSDKENFTLEELLDEEIIQECKALNSRLINFLRD
ncbi:hypothetical protein K7X08_003644 [Anisodus acutangulus]|uniref:Uncharacterized protein n=1 Tax=Anisodus acutangulus TaxID=402998 RepID=A0A9Q1MG12_9SOLA|nr:hypothetical protein K7X08_003644 [Anisodus acutangulus]